MSDKLKPSYATSPETQAAKWSVRFLHLKGGVDTDALDRARLQAKRSHSFVCVLPKPERIFDKNESSLYLDLQFLEILERSCEEQSVRLHNKLPRMSMSGKTILTEKERYRDFREATAGQRGDFIVFAMDLGQGLSYREGTVRPSKGRLPLPLGVIAAALSVQKMEELWKYNPNMWTASLTTEIDKGKKDRFELPCFFFERNLGDKDILCLCSLETLFYYNGEKRGYGGFSTALCAK